MTESVLSLDVNAPAAEILRLFAGYPLHHLPVVDGSKVVGMISSADVMKLETFLPKHDGNGTDYLNQHLRIDTIMRKPPITIHGDEPILSAATLMAKHGIHALPVTDADGNLLGIVTTTDIIHAALHADRAGPARERSVSDGSVARSLSPAAMDQALRLASTLAAADDNLGTLARALLETRLHLQPLEQVMASAERYMRSGQDAQLHSNLTQAIARVRGDATASSWLF
jgi:CBS domain-containing protein